MGITMQIYNTYICPSANALMDIGSSAKQWKNLYVDGLAYIDTLGEALDLGDFNLTSAAFIYGVDNDVSISLATDGKVIINADTSVDITANLDISTKNIITDTSTGTKIGTASNQKLGFWGVSPVVQQTKIQDPTESGASLDSAVEAIIDALEAVGITAS